jgi:glycosyltransferase involved in cell wall biosynthesis
MSERIAIIQLVNGFAVESTGGGASRFGITLGRHINPERFDVTVAGLWSFGKSYELDRFKKNNTEGIAAVVGAKWKSENPLSSFWSSFINLRKKLSDVPYQIIHSHSEFGDVMAILLKAFLGNPILIRTVHNGYPLEWRKKPLRRLFLTNILYPMMFKTEIGVSENITHGLDRRWLANQIPKKSVHIPNAIDLTKFANPREFLEDIRDEFIIPPETFVVGSIGRFVEEKGYLNLIEAARIVCDKYPNTKFIVIGEGELLQEYKSLAEQLDIPDKISFIGPQANIEYIYSCFDLFVSTSFWEGLSTVILESMAAKVPVIATDIPANQEFMVDGFNGWLISPRQSDKLAQVILEALGNPRKRAEIANNALDTVKKYSIASVALEHEELYLNVTSNTN